MKSFSCIVCNNKEHDLLPEVSDFEFGVIHKSPLYRCKKCNLISMHPVPSINEIVTFYPGYHAYETKRSKVMEMLLNIFWNLQANKVKKLIGNTKQGKILEIGCSFGPLLERISKISNHEVWGVDINESAIEEAKKRGIKGFAGTLEQISLPENYFDLIIMDHVIEHVSSPIETLNICNKLLKSNGLVLGETPTTDSWDYQIWGKYWAGLHYPRHLNIFNKNNLNLLAKLTGFSLVECTNIIQPGHWAVSTQNYLNSSTPLKAKIKNGRAFYTPLLMFIYLPLNLIEKIFCKSSIVRFVMKKDQ